jgi:triosephosphate isomerase (TIM)
MARRPLVIGNWKMNGSLLANHALVGGLVASVDITRALAAGVEVAVCPSAVHVAIVAAQLRDLSQSRAGQAMVQLGAQDASEYTGGAFTGETGAAMLKEVGARFVLLGHSERRSLFSDSNERVRAKVAAVLAEGLVPVICVGETLEQRDAGATQAVVGAQLDVVAPLLAQLADSAFVVAYEPVWAIGTGKTASPEQAQQVHAFIRNRLVEQGVAAASQVRLLYGGSVKAANAEALFGQVDIDGGLIGGAALVVEDFAAIVAAANNTK